MLQETSKTKTELLAEIDALREQNRWLESRVDARVRDENLRAVLFEIVDVSVSTKSLEDLYPALHEIVARLMYAENFFIALCDEEHEYVSMPYYVDLKSPDKAPPMPKVEFQKKLTGYVLRTGESLLATKQDILRMRNQGLVNVSGELCLDWLGVPLIVDEEVLGVMVVQSYDKLHGYTEHDKNLLVFVSHHIAVALWRKRSEEVLAQAQDDLERRVAQRTEELSNANAAHSKKMLELERAEKLQKVLFQISDLTNSAKSMDEFYAHLHKTIGELMYAKNFFVALADTSNSMLHFPYVVDEYPKDGYSSRKLDLKNSRGLTEHVLTSKTPLLILPNEVVPDDKRYGHDSVAWLGVPLFIREDEADGVLAVQSYDKEVIYGDADKNLLNFVAKHVATALRRKNQTDELRTAHKKLSGANIKLAKEIDEREQAEKLQRALFEITDLSNTAENLESFYRSLHEIIGSLTYAKNFFIATVSEDRKLLEFPYYADEVEPNYSKSRPLDLDNPKGYTEKVLSNNEPVYLDNRLDTEKKECYGIEPEIWIGVPLQDDLDNSIGVLAVQSYDPDVEYSTSDRELLHFVSKHVSTALQRKRDSEQLVSAHEKLKSMQKELVEAAHQAGMSEIATGILHNIGNLLNSINTSTGELDRISKNSKVSSLKMVVELLQENSGSLAEFLTKNPKGKKLPVFLHALGENLCAENSGIVDHASNVRKCVKTINEVIATQQKYAGVNLHKEVVVLSSIVEDALSTQSASFEKETVKVNKDFQCHPKVSIQKSKTLNVLVNLFKNAREALEENEICNRCMDVSIVPDGSNTVCVKVTDNGGGIEEKNLEKIFSHGFTTKSDGHGFGLHSCATAMLEMGGDLSVESGGPRFGATFTLRFPVT